MDTLYFYENAGQTAGPVPGSQLLANGVQASTLVWCEKMPDWVAAGTVPELRNYFVSKPSTHSTTTPPTNSSPSRTVPPQSVPTPSSSSGLTGKKLLLGVIATLALGGVLASQLTLDKAEEELSVAQVAPAVPTQEEEIKEIGYAANHPDEVDDQAAKERQEDAIESIDNDNGWLTIHYTSGKTIGTGLSDKRDWFFAYSPHLIVVHNERNECSVRDIYNNRITEGTTRNDGTTCTGLRMVGDRIVIDIDTGHSTYQETYDEKLHLLRTSPSQLY